jgi:hypothetical protein
VVLAKDTPSLEPFLCDTQIEIMERLERGESGLFEIAQGYQLSLMSKFYPKATSRNVSVAAALDDALLPPVVAGPFIANLRTFPIRVNSNKYVRISDGKILTWAEWGQTPEPDRKKIVGDSGGWYADQLELTWEDISKNAGKTIFEQTSLTKLPRRVASFSRIVLDEGLRFNDIGDDIYISINFMNYVDGSVEGKRTTEDIMTTKVKSWIKENILRYGLGSYWDRVRGYYIGTWKTIDDSIFINADDLRKIVNE